MPTIDLTGSTIRPQSRKSGKMYAKVGYDIKCHFTVKNTSSKRRSVWWAIHDHYRDRRLKSGTINLNPGSSRSYTMYVTMPSNQVNLKFWAGTIESGRWYNTDSAGFSPIYLDKPSTPQVGYVNVKAKVPLGGYVSGAEILVDGKRSGVYTPGTVSMSPGRHWVRISKTGYIPGTGLYRDTKAGRTINLELSLVPVSVPKPVSCGISPGIRTPDKLPLKFSAAGAPSPPSSFMIHTTFTAICREAGKSVATPSGMPNLPIMVSLGGMPIKNFSTRGNYSFNALNGVVALIYAGRITKSMRSIRLEVRYPKTITFESKTSSGRITQYDTFRKEIPLDITTVIPEVICNIAGSLSNPGEIPLTLPAGGFGIPTLDVAAPITAMFGASGCKAPPANLMDYLEATVTLNNQSPIKIRPDRRGNATFNLSRFSLPSISDTTRTLELKMRFPQRMRCSTPTPEGTQEITRTISIKPEMPGLPECVLTEADYFRCPDGTRIQILECVDGIKIPTGMSPVDCPVTLPPVTPPVMPPAPPCVLTAADYFTCPDGAVIQINECRNGVKVPTGTTCPTVTPTCVLTAADYFTCPDGAVIQINECRNGVKVPTGARCPTPTPPTPTPPPTPGECPTPTVVVYKSDMRHTPGIPGSPGTWNVRARSNPGGVGRTITSSTMELHGPRGYALKPLSGPVGEGWYGLDLTNYGMWVLRIKVDNDCGATSGWVEFSEVFSAPPPVTPPVTPPVVPPSPTCVIAASDYFRCPDGSVIQLNECRNGVKVPTGTKCPSAPTPTRQTKTVNVTAPMLIRVGRKVRIAGQVFCGTERVGGEKAWISINGELLTTANTRNGAVNVSWNPSRPGLYNICITVPESSACNASGSACTTVQVVRELSTPEIEAAEAEFLRAKERIGKIMERI